MAGVCVLAVFRLKFVGERDGSENVIRLYLMTFSCS